MPAQRVIGSCTTITSQAISVPIPPSTAKSGQSTPRTLRFGRALYGTSSAAKR